MKEDLIRDLKFRSKIEELLRKKQEAENTNGTGEAEGPPPGLTAVFEDAGPAMAYGAALKSTGSPVSEDLLDAMELAEARAAVSGSFVPDELFDVAGEPQKEPVLNSLAQCCTTKATDGKMTWLLNPDRRIKQLQRLVAENKLTAVLQQSLPATDAFGQMLREVLLKGSGISLLDKTNEQLLALVSVMEIIGPLSIDKPELAGIKKLTKKSSAVQEYSLLSAHFIGREAELLQMDDFLNNNSGHWWDCLLLTGHGGTGKSTLLAKFTGSVLQQERGTTVLLDFDRPGLDINDPGWLEEEIVRQIGLQYEEIADSLNTARNEYRQIRARESLSSSQSSRSSKELLFIIREQLQKSHNDQKPLLLVLDTLEEVTQQGLTERLFSWLSATVEMLLPIRTKVILSGRVSAEVLSYSPGSKHIAISEFDAAIAQQFLVEHGLDRKAAEQVIASGLLPLRPLELKLIAGVLLKNEISIGELQQDIQNEKDSSGAKELFIGIIYRRILQRIKDPLLRQIAYPGLVLRYLTADLLQHVLQPALGLPEMDAAQRDKIMEELAKYTWLIHNEGNGELWHSRELRRSMLKLMNISEPEKTLAIRLKAFQYFSSLKTNAGMAEATYHRLMAFTSREEGNDLDLDLLAMTERFIGSSILDLPKPAAVLVEFATSSKVDVADIDLLPDRFFLKAYDATGRRLVRNEQYGRAYELYERAKSLGHTQWAKGSRIQDYWEREMLFATANWDELEQRKDYQDTEMKGFLSIVNYIFPAALVSPGFINIALLENMMDTLQMSYSGSITEAVRGPDSKIIVSRIAYGLTLVNHVGNLFGPNLPGRKPERSKVTIYMLFDDFDLLIKNPTLISSRHKNILKCLADGEPLEDYTLSPSLIRIDAEWLINLKQYIPESRYSMVDRLLDIFSRENSVNKFLTAVDASKEDRALWADTKIDLRTLEPEEIYRLVSGPHSTFRDPCRYAVYEAFKESGDFEELARIIADVLPVRIKDHEPMAFSGRVKESGAGALDGIIELVDRCGVMAEFLSRARSSRPGAKKLQRVAAAYELWVGAYKALIYGDTKKR